MTAHNMSCQPPRNPHTETILTERCTKPTGSLELTNVGTSKMTGQRQSGKLTPLRQTRDSGSPSLRLSVPAPPFPINLLLYQLQTGLSLDTRFPSVRTRVYLKRSSPSNRATEGEDKGENQSKRPGWERM